MVNIAINGFGRIGRNVLRALYESGRNNEFNVVAINDIAKPEGIAHLLKYDTAHGRFRFDVALENNTLNVAGDDITLLAISDIKDLPWKDLGVDIVLECTGKFDDRASGASTFRCRRWQSAFLVTRVTRFRQYGHFRNQ